MAEAKAQGVGKKEATPYLLRRVVELSGGKSLEANIALIRNNAVLAAQTAVELMKLSTRPNPWLGPSDVRARSSTAYRFS